MHFGPAPAWTSRIPRCASLLLALVWFAAWSRAQSPNHFQNGGDSSTAVSAPGYSLDAPAAADSQKVEDARLIGYWEHRTERGKISLEFLSENRMVFAGRNATYTLGDGTLRVKDELGYTEYSYQVRGDTLVLNLMDETRRGAELSFTRVSLSPDENAGQ